MNTCMPMRPKYSQSGLRHHRSQRLPWTSCRTEGVATVRSTLAAKFVEQRAMVGEPPAENRLGHAEQIADARIGQRVPHRRPLFAADNDAARAQPRELLRHDRLIELEPGLQRPHALFAF